MSNKFSEALKVILHHEGGYVNHPKDPGGMTNMGVTKRVYEEWVGYSVSENTMQNLKKEDVVAIVVGWIKTIFMDYKVEIIEKLVQKAIDSHNEKVI